MRLRTALVVLLAGWTLHGSVLSASCKREIYIYIDESASVMGSRTLSGDSYFRIALDELEEVLSVRSGEEDRESVHIQLFGETLSNREVLSSGDQISPFFERLRSREVVPSRLTDLRLPFQEIASLTGEPEDQEVQRTFVIVSDFAHDVAEPNDNPYANDLLSMRLQLFEPGQKGDGTGHSLWKKRFHDPAREALILLEIPPGDGPGDAIRADRVTLDIEKAIPQVIVLDAEPGGPHRLAQQLARMQEGVNVLVQRSSNNQGFELFPVGQTCHPPSGKLKIFGKILDPRKGATALRSGSVVCDWGESATAAPQASCLIEDSQIYRLSPSQTRGLLGNRCEEVSFEVTQNGTTIGENLNRMHIGECVQIERAVVEVTTQQTQPKDEKKRDKTLRTRLQLKGQIGPKPLQVAVLGSDGITLGTALIEPASFNRSSASQSREVSLLIPLDEGAGYRDLCSHRDARRSNHIRLQLMSLQGASPSLLDARELTCQDDGKEPALHSLWEKVSVPLIVILLVLGFVVWLSPRPSMAKFDENLSVLGLGLAAMFWALHDTTNLGSWLASRFEGSERMATIVLILLFGLAFFLLSRMGLFQDPKSPESLRAEVRWWPYAERRKARRLKNRLWAGGVVSMTLFFIILASCFHRPGGLCTFQWPTVEQPAWTEDSISSEP